jgi:hypothetical protein
MRFLECNQTSCRCRSDCNFTPSGEEGRPVARQESVAKKWPNIRANPPRSPPPQLIGRSVIEGIMEGKESPRQLAERAQGSLRGKRAQLELRCAKNFSVRPDSQTGSLLGPRPRSAFGSPGRHYQHLSSRSCFHPSLRRTEGPSWVSHSFQKKFQNTSFPNILNDLPSIVAVQKTPC